MNKNTRRANLEEQAGISLDALTRISWSDLNSMLSKSTDTVMCKALLELELAGAKRLRYAQRIYSRYSTLRRFDEAQHIIATCPYRKRGERA